MSKVSLITGGLIISYHSLSLISSFLEKLQSEELPRPEVSGEGGYSTAAPWASREGRPIREQSVFPWAGLLSLSAMAACSLCFSD